MTTDSHPDSIPHPGAQSTPANARILSFAVGRAGTAIAEELIRGGFAPGNFVVLNRDTAALARSAAAEKIPLPKASQRGTARGRSPTELPFPIKKLCEGVDVVFVVAGLGGRTGTEFAPLVAKAVKEAGLVVLALVTLPFDCEGNSRQEKACAALEALKAVADGVVCLPNQKVCKLIAENTSLLDTFKVSNVLLADGLRGVWRMVTAGGLIDIHLSDLCMLIGGQHVESVFAAAEVSGPERSRDVVKKLLTHPLLDGGQALHEAEAVLVSVVGGRDLAIADVNRVMGQVNQYCENVPVIMGAAIDESFADRLAVTLLASRRRGPARQAPESAELPSESSDSPSRRGVSDLDDQLLPPTTMSRPHSRIVAPPPEMSQDGMQRLLAQQNGATGRRRKSPAKMRQGQLPLEIVSRGRFDKSEPTIHKGEDLDLPTYVRRGVVLN